MLAPIVTKEMKLFPSQPLPPRIKNVRSRAQSLQDFANGNAIHVTTQNGGAHTATPAHLLLNPNGRGTARSRNSQSIGSLPTNQVLANGFHGANNNRARAPNNAIALVPTAKTPPKYSTSSASLRKPLDSIVEGLELAQGPSAGGSSSSPSSQQQLKSSGGGAEGKEKAKKVLAALRQSTTTTKPEEGGSGGKQRKGAGAIAKSCPHRSSHDGLLAVNRANSSAGASKVVAEKEKRAQRTHSMEGGRKKRTAAAEGRGTSGGSSSSAGCFAMWLSSKFRRSGNGESTESAASSTTTTTAGEREEAAEEGKRTAAK